MNDAKFYLKDKNKPSTTINMIFWYYGKRFWYSTGVRVLTREWNDRKYRVRASSSYPDYLEINNILDNLNNLAKDTLKELNREFPEPTERQFERRFHRNLEGGGVDADITIVSYIEKLIEQKREVESSKSSIDHLTRIKANLSRFPHGEDLLFRDFDVELFEEVKTFFFSLNHEQNYVRDLMKRLRTVFRLALTHNIHQNTTYDYIGFLPEKKDVDKIVLSLEELKAIYEHNFEDNKRLERVRDAFIIQCDCGLRYTDLKEITTDVNSKSKVPDFSQSVFPSWAG